MRARDVFAVAISIFAVYITLQSRSEYYLKHAWTVHLPTKHYANGDFPEANERLPAPVLADLEGNGVTELIVATREPSIRIYDTSHLLYNHDSEKRFAKEHLRLKHEVSLLSKSHVQGPRQPVAMTVGKLTAHETKQHIVVLTSDWTVMCFHVENSQIKLKWIHNPMKVKATDIIHLNPTIAIIPVRLRAADLGLVVVASSLKISDYDDHVKDLTARAEKLAANPSLHSEEEKHDGYNIDVIQQEIEELERLSRLNVFAFDGGRGIMRWGYTQDTEPRSHDNVKTLQQHNYKLTLEHELQHAGESDWRTFRSSVLDLLPFRWDGSSDTRIDLAHFSKHKPHGKRKKSEKHKKLAHHKKETGLHSADRSKVENTNLHAKPHKYGPTMKLKESHAGHPNVVAVGASSGIHVLHLYTGRLLTQVPLDPHAVHVDINHDGTIDNAQNIIGTGTALKEIGHTWVEDADKFHCVQWVTTGTPVTHILYNNSVCARGHARNLHSVFASGIVNTDVEPTAVAPLAVHRPSHADAHNRNVELYDIVTYMSDGSLLSAAPSGSVNFHVFTAPHFSAKTTVFVNHHTTHEGGNVEKKVLDIPTVVTLAEMKIRPHDLFHHIVTVGAGKMSIFDRQGLLLCDAPLPNPPVQKALLADVNNDGLQDVIISTRNGVIGFTLQHRSSLGLLGFLVTSVVAVVACAVLINIRDVDVMAPGVVKKRGSD